MSGKHKDQQNSHVNGDSVQVGWVSAMGSSVAAAFGVQSHKNRVRDFESGDIKKFVISGVTLTFAILFSLVALVQVVLGNVS